MERIENLQQALQWYDNIIEDFISAKIITDALYGDVPPFYDKDFLQRAYEDSLYFIEKYDLQGVIESCRDGRGCYEMRKSSQCAAGIVEVAMLNGNDEMRRYLLKRIFDNAQYYLKETNNQKEQDVEINLQLDKLTSTVKDVGEWFFCSVGNFIYLVSLVAARLGYNVKEFSKEDIPDKKLIDMFYKQLQEPQEEQKTYAVMPRAHRIATVYKLLDAAGVNSNNTDRTVMAGIVEAVTGGNIQVKPRDTLSYKRPERTAIKGADECLKPIAAILDNAGK